MLFFTVAGSALDNTSPLECRSIAVDWVANARPERVAQVDRDMLVRRRTAAASVSAGSTQPDAADTLAPDAGSSSKELYMGPSI